MSSEKPEFTMRGGRFAPLTWETMTVEQQAMTTSVLSGSRGSMQGPYNVLLRSPELGNLAQAFGAHTRFNSSLPLALNELVILLIAHHWRCQFVWWAHKKIGIDAGLAPEAVTSIAAGKAPRGLNPEASAVYTFASELIREKQVSDSAFKTLVTFYGERGAVDLMATMSYYTLVSMSLNVDRYPLPEGAQPELFSEGS